MMNQEVCDRFCYCSQNLLPLSVLGIIFLCLTDTELGLVTYFDQKKVRRTAVCPFQSIKYHCTVSIFGVFLPGDLPIPDRSSVMHVQCDLRS